MTAIRTCGGRTNTAHRLTPRSPLVHRSTPVIDDACQMLLLAKDGIYLPKAPRAITQGILASGNRADVLINCPEGDFIFESRPYNSSTERPTGDTSSINGTLLHIRSVGDFTPPPSQCDLPVFEVNRPCCDWPPFRTSGSPTICTSADPVFASCFGQTSSICAAKRWQRT